MAGKNKKKKGANKQYEAAVIRPFAAHVDGCATESDYAHAVIQQVASGICRNVGYRYAEGSSILVMTEILEQYIQTLAEISRSYTELAARTQGNLLDLRAAFHCMGVDVKGLCAYANNNRTGIFETPIPTFPLPAAKLPTSTVPMAALLKERPEPRPPHIPPFCPPLPPAHTYKSTPVFVAPERNVGEERAQKTREKRDVETALGQFAVKTRVLPSKRIKDDVAVLMMPRPPPYMSAIVGENALKVQESDLVSGKPGRDPARRAGPGIVVSQPLEDDRSEGEWDGTPQASPAPGGSVQGSAPPSPLTPSRPDTSAMQSREASPLPT